MAVFKAENLHNIRGNKILMGKEKRALLLHEELIRPRRITER